MREYVEGFDSCIIYDHFREMRWQAKDEDVQCLIDAIRKLITVSSERVKIVSEAS